MFHLIWLKVFIQPIYNLLILSYWPFKDLGAAIIIVTIIFRLILYPLFKKQLHTQRELNALQHEINKIKEKYKRDPQKVQLETLKLYQERGVAPWSGCLPMLLQLPIFIALYQVFRVYLSTEKFALLYSFVPHPTNLSVISFGFLHLDKPDFYVLPWLVGLTQYFLTKMMTPQPKSDPKKPDLSSQMAQANKMMLYFMPGFFVLISFSLPSAIVLYFLISNLFSIVQNYIFLRTSPQVKIRTKDDKEKSKKKS